MAYVQGTVTATPSMAGGVAVVAVSFSETGVTSTSEATIPRGVIPLIGTITSYTATLDSGTGTTIQPAVGRAALFVVSTQDHIASQSAAAAHIRDRTSARYNLLDGQDLIIRSTPDAGTNNVVSTAFVIRQGHE